MPRLYGQRTMTDPPTSFARATPGVQTADALHDGEFTQVYTGTVDATAGAVRLFVLSPSASETTVESAFERAVCDWVAISSCSGVTTVHDHGSTPRPWVAVECVDGDRLSAADLPLEVASARSLLAELAETLRQVHQRGVYHGSLTPDDVWIASDGVRVDWNPEQACRRAAGREPGPYTAPELVGEDRCPDERTDVFGLGAVAYTAVTGERPGEAETERNGAVGATDRPPASAINPDVPAQCDQLLDAALARDPDERHATPYEFKLALLFESQDDAPVEQSKGTTADGRRPSVPQQPPSAAGGQRAERDSDRDAASDGFPMSRRTALGAAGLGLAGIAGWLATAPLAGSSSGGSVPMLQYDPGKTGYASDANGPTAGAEVTWTADGHGSLQPIVADGKLYLAGDGGLSAVDAGDGSDRWSIDREGFWSPPAVSDGRVHVVRGQRQDDDPPTFTVSAYDADDGTTLWDSDEMESGQVFFSIPSLVDGTLYFRSGNGLHAIDSSDGTELWRFDDLNFRTPIQAFDDERVYGISSEGLHAIGLDGPAEQWSVDAQAATGLTVTDGTVYFSRRGDGSDEHTVEAVDAENGEQRWTVPVDGWSFGPAAVADGRLYAGTESGTVYAIDTADGSVDWTTAEPDLQSALEPAAVTDDTLYITEGSGTVSALDVTDGSERWAMDLGERASVPSVVDGALYVDSDETLYALSEP